MVDYKDLDKFYIGIEWPVIMNCGGIYCELGESCSALFYKISDDIYADVNNKGRIVQAFRKGTIVTSSYILDEESLVQVKNKQEIIKNSSFIKRMTFKSTNYNQSRFK